MIVISDTSPITSLAAIGQLDLLRQLYNIGLRITGLLGVLIEAKQKGFILAVKPLLNQLIATAEFRVADALYARILHIVAE
ncbi:DUF3368 domain-containing protein [Nostoc sp.]|uniref:DUF3368 domain-containing protein n=1 Tax=Nostoc sp. TaxID=1180 RepID=UPI002FF55913